MNERNALAPLTEAELTEIERTATDLQEAIRLDDSIAGWPEHFDEDFAEALNQDKALRLVAEIRRLRSQPVHHDAEAPEK